MEDRELQLPQADTAFRLVSDQPAIRVEHVSKSYGATTILKDVHFDLTKGKIYSIMGPSGCGKSTLLKMMIGAEAPSGGHILIDGIDIWNKADPSARKLARRKFGVMFQGSALLNDLTCGENVALPLRQHTDLLPSTIDMMVRMKLELVGMGHAIDLLPSKISGGMKKRCALARAIALDPAIVFFDEPSAGIDPVMVAVLDRLIMDLTEKLGITSVVITHEMPSAFRISDEMLMMWDGCIHFRGTPDQFRNSRDPVVSQFIHGDADGPISKSLRGSALAARILDIPESELVTTANHRTLRQTQIVREGKISERFRAVSRTVAELNPDTRAKRTMHSLSQELEAERKRQGDPQP